MRYVGTQEGIAWQTNQLIDVFAGDSSMVFIDLDGPDGTPSDPSTPASRSSG
jgi:hypothetical protein